MEFRLLYVKRLISDYARVVIVVSTTEWRLVLADQGGPVDLTIQPIVTCSLNTDEFARALLNVGGPDNHEELPCRWRYMPRKEWFQAGNKQSKE